MPSVQKLEHYFDPPASDLVRAALRHDATAAEGTGADPNTVGRESMTPLIYAVLKEDLEAIKLLLRIGANPNVLVPGAGSATAVAAKLENTRPLITLLDHGADAKAVPGNNPASWSAARAENRPALEILFAHGLSIDARNKRGETLLMDTCSVNNTDLANWLVDRGADVRAVDTLFSSAPGYVQQFLNTKAANNTKLPGFRELQAKFEQRGVRFPVPTIPELKQRFGRAMITPEEALKLDERGEAAQAHSH